METIDNPEIVSIEKKRYPLLMDRAKAKVADVVCIIVLMLIFGYVFEKMGEVSDFTRKISFLFLFVVYDPLTITLLGGTPGHLMNNLVVRKNSDHKGKINLGASFFSLYD